MKFPCLILLTSLFYGTFGYAQSASLEELYMPLEFERAYENGTRSKDGGVPQKYWQNKSSYRIEASLNPKTKLLEGSAKITYFNNSPDTLKSVVFHTYQDYLKPYASRQGYNMPNTEIKPHKGVEIENLMVAQEKIDINDSRKVYYGGTNYTVQLSENLLPNDSLSLQIEWNYVIPEENFERSGAADSTSMFIGYWYPEIAVYDDIFGWDRKAFDAATEFYHDFSDYEISITVPDNFTVWASVAPENPEEIYSEAIQTRLEKAKKSSKPVEILTQKDFRKTSKGTKTWKYKVKNFPDFAFALSDHFLWNAATYEDEEGRYFVQTAYPYTNSKFSKILPTLSTSLETFHQSFPKYPFPYKYFTVFNGQKGGGMEFPGMANNGYNTKEDFQMWFDMDITEKQELQANLDLTLHEMSHMYFPFMMGINEKKFAWMDEGFAEVSKSFLEPWRPKLDLNFSSLGSLSAVPMLVPSDEHNKSYINAYQISGAFYRSLFDLLGEDNFHKTLHAFMDEWKYKHPSPYDMIFTFNRKTEEDLNWFFNNWLFDWGYVDLGIDAVEDQQIQISNHGGRAVSFKIKITFNDGSSQTDLVSPEVWKHSEIYNHSFGSKSLEKVELILPLMGDAVTENNIWEQN